MRPSNQKRYGHGRGRTNNNNHSSSRNTSKQYNRNTSFESNGPNGRLRGTAQQLAEKYQQHARDAAANGDFVLKENHLQHAEYYSRMFGPLDATPEVTENETVSEEKNTAIDATAPDNVAPAPAAPAEASQENGLYAGQNQQRPRRRRWEMEDKPKSERQTSAKAVAAATPETAGKDAFKGDMPAFLNLEGEPSDT